jgi:aryl-alcohol dehydrogenase-like predicted oxidoreductase
MDHQSSPVTRRIGLGCMALTGIYGPISRDNAVKIVRHALDLGITHFDTAELYGPYLNEELLSNALGSDRTKVEIGTKFGYRFHDGKIVGLDSRPPSIRQAVEGSLRRLRRDYVDVLYQHRPDPEVPVEDVVGIMSDLVSEGKVLSLGLSATDLPTLRRASAVHPISLVQNEFSLIQRAAEKLLLPGLLGTATEFVCYSPLGRGILTGRAIPAQRSPTDYRSKDVWFQPARLAEVTERLAPLWRIAASRLVSPATVALAWLLSRAPTIRVIPGATNVEQLNANISSVATVLTEDEIAALDATEETKDRPVR